MNTEHSVTTPCERRRELHLVSQNGSEVVQVGSEARYILKDVRLALIRLEIELWRLEVFLHAEEIQKEHASQEPIQ